MKTVDGIINDVINVEKGYVNNAKDKGGPTKYGITQATARANGYTGDMRDLPRSKAYQIYYDVFVMAPKFDQIVAVNAAIGAEVVDTGVNMGQPWGAKFLQRALNALAGAGLDVDGKIGPKSVAALRNYLSSRKADGESNLLKCINSLQCVRYIEIVERDASQRTFINGWVGQRVSI